MTAACGGGTSSARFTSPATAIVTGLSLEAIAEAVLGVSSPWIALLVAVAQYSINTAELCATDPPAWPIFDGGEALEFVTLGPGASEGVLTKVQHLVWNLTWTTFCQCDAGSATGLPAPTTYPPTGPTGTPPGSGGIPIATGSPCATFASTTDWVYAPSSGFQFELYFDSDTTADTVLLTSTVTNAVFTATNNVISGTGITITLRFQAIDQFGTIIKTVANNQSWAPGDTMSVPFEVPPHTRNILIGPISATGSGQSDWYDPATNAPGYHVDWWCGSTPSGPLQPCCPPDPNVSTALAQIQNMLASILASIPVPVTSWAEGTVHHGLSGHGGFGLTSSTLSVRVDLTTIPGWIDRTIGSPDFYFDCGFIAFTTVEGSYSSQRITFATQVFTVPLLGFDVSYTLENGVVADFTELTRGP